MRTIISLTTFALLCLTLFSGCGKTVPSGDLAPTFPPRPCAETKDPSGNVLELLFDKTGETLHLGVYQNGIPKEIVSVLIINRRPYGVIIKKDGKTIFDKRFTIPEEKEISTPMELSLSQIKEGEAIDPSLNPIIDVARQMPKLEYMPLFADLFPVRVYYESMYSGILEYADGNTARTSFSGRELTECTKEEQGRQYTLRMKNCDQSWQEYINSAHPRDTDCLMCLLLLLDPCTGQPIDGEAILGCIFGGPIGCGISIGIAILLYSSAAH